MEEVGKKEQEVVDMVVSQFDGVFSSPVEYPSKEESIPETESGWIAMTIKDLKDLKD